MIETFTASFTANAYLFVFLGSLLESFIITGIFLPGSVLVLLGGYYAHQGDVSLPFVIISAFFGMVIGDIVNYFLGKSAWNSRLERSFLGKKLFSSRTRAKRFIEKYGVFSFFYSHFLGSLRSVVCFIAGVTHYPTKKYIVINIIAAFIWSVIFSLSGYFIAGTVDDVSDLHSRFGVVALILLVFFVGAKLFQKGLQSIISRKRGKK